MQIHRSRLAPFAALLLLFATSVARPDDERQLARELQDVQKRLDEERTQWLEFQKSATTEEERAALVEAFPREEYAGELRSIAERAKGTEVAARAWFEAQRLATMLDDRALFEQALARLSADHVASPIMGNLALDLVYGAPAWTAPAAADALRKIVAGNPDKGTQSGALVELALLVGLDASFGAAGQTEAEALLARVEREFGDGEFIGMTGKEFAAGARHEIEHLRVGQVAPEFELPDQHGVRFKLSDYRGRVVMLDFWGFV